MAQKRERGTNFTREETDLLIQLVNENKHVLENKKSDAVTWAEKELCWQKIEKQFNSTSGVHFRNAKALKIKYDGIKRDTRKKSAAIRAETYRTGGGPSTAPILTSSEEKVKSMILLSVEGMESVFDSDQLPETASHSEIIATAIESTNINDQPEHVVLENGEKDCEITEDPKEIIFLPTLNLSCDNDQKIKRKRNNSEDTDITANAQWSQWKPTSLRTRKHPALCKQKPKRPFEKVAESKLEIACIQKQILLEELESKRKQALFEEEERQHKRAIWDLEKQLLQNKIDHFL